MYVDGAKSTKGAKLAKGAKTEKAGKGAKGGTVWWGIDALLMQVIT